MQYEKIKGILEQQLQWITRTSKKFRRTPGYYGLYVPRYSERIRALNERIRSNGRKRRKLSRKSKMHTQCSQSSVLVSRRRADGLDQKVQSSPPNWQSDCSRLSVQLRSTLGISLLDFAGRYIYSPLWVHALFCLTLPLHAPGCTTMTPGPQTLPLLLCLYVLPGYNKGN